MASPLLSRSYVLSGVLSRPQQPSLACEDGGQIETPLWIYEDSQGIEQGPFTATQMQLWHQYNFLPPTTRVRHVREQRGVFKLLGAVPQLCGNRHPPEALPAMDGIDHVDIVDSVSQAIADEVERNLGTRNSFEDYRVVGTWVNGRFTPADRAGDAHFTAKGLPPDREGRMMAHYFDHDKWQEEMNARKAAGQLAKKRSRMN